MLVTGFPSADDSVTGIFNLRAARALNGSADVAVVHLRTWRPSRPFMQADTIDGLTVYRVAIPQVPAFKKASFEFYKIAAWPLVKQLVKDCDVIHSVGLSFAALVGAHWARLASVRHVTQVTSEFELDKTQLQPSEETVKSIHAVACNSDALATMVRRAYPSARNVRTVYRGVDLERFTSDSTLKDAEPAPTERGVRFLYLGGFPGYRTKGGETLLAAWQTAETELAHASAGLIIGGPRSTDKSVLRWRAELRYPERVELAGTINTSDVPRYLSSSNAVLVPSLVEGFPNIAVEASACGRAVLASNLDAIAELVVDGETGVLLPAGDAAAWASALIDFARRPGDLWIFGRNARKRAELLFDARAYPVNMLSLYRAALREPLKETQSPAYSLTMK
jgi:glycosyltransferase involved in cell wall biosynthesis